MIRIELDDRGVRNALKSLEKAVANPRPALKEIGESLVESTKQRFPPRKDPDGKRWRRNSRVTIERKGRDFPLTGETKELQTQIHWQVEGSDTLIVGSTMDYAEIHQFGGKQSEFPELWGNIPARPFLGISVADKEEILDILSDYLSKQF